MRYLLLLLTFICFVLNGCKTGDESATPTALPSPTAESASAPHFATEGVVSFSRSGLSVELPRPAGWESFSTEHGIVIAEKFGTVADKGELHGLMAYIFVTPLSEFTLPVNLSGERNVTEQIMSIITSDPDAIGTLQISTVEGFLWEENDAAYYLFTDSHTHLQTLVMSVIPPESEVMLTITISAPPRMSDKIRAAAPILLNGLSLNERPIGMDDLRALPDTLLFP